MSIVDKDPVCGKFVGAHTIETVYAGIHYAFCSDQCREQFVAHPHLYVGYPGYKAPRQKGMQVVKRRLFKLEQPLSLQEGALLTEDLHGMMGVHEVHVDGMAVEVTYDLLQATAEQIEARLAEIGLKLGGEWPERLRRSFVHFLEESEVSGLEELPHKNPYPEP